MDLTPLWAYQKVDMQIENIESTLKKSQARRTALKLRAYINEQSTYRAACEESLQTLTGKLSELKTQAEALAKQATERSFSADEDMQSEQLAEKLDALQDVLQRMESTDAQLVAFIEEMEEQTKKLADAQKNIPIARREYNEAKAIFDKEMADATPGLQTLQAQRAECAKTVDDALLKRYEQIRQNRLPPIAKLLGEQCGGCSMQLPSTAIRTLKAGQRIVECENCGRILSA